MEDDVCICRQGADIKLVEWYHTLKAMLKQPEDQDEIVAACKLDKEIEFLEMQIEVNECYCGE